MIASDSRIVIVGDLGALERLQGELPCEGISLRPIEDFLAGYDRQTISGEEQLRRMEELYSSLRGKLIVRLMLVNLNPEVLLHQGDRLAQLAKDWKDIELRLNELLQERKHEGIEFVTILVTEEGDWTKERKPVLEGFMKAPEGCQYKMRCYLMTRLLELGRDRVVHARDAWPVFVGGLIRHFLWKAQHLTDQGRFFDVEGLFAWRTLKVVAEVPESVVQEKTKAILKKVTVKFFGERPSALFLDPLVVEVDNAGGRRFEANVQNPFGQATWSELGIKEETKLSALEAPSKWELATQAHAYEERKSAWGGRGNESPKPSETAGARVNEAREIPGKIFPGSLPTPPIRELPDVKSVLKEIQGKLDEVNAQTRKIRDWWEDHLQAACGFLVTSERLIVGLIVSMALAYGILSIQMTVQKYLPGSLFPFESGVIFASLAIAGVVATLLIGYVTQRWRGRVAQKKLIDLGNSWISENVGLRQKITDSLRGSKLAGARIREAAARRQLVKRLQRIEHILTAELQPSSVNHGDGLTSLVDQEEVDQVQRYRKLLEVAVSSSHKSNFSEDEMVQTTTKKFFRDWEQLLEASGKNVMIPATSVLTLCRRSVGDLQYAVNTELRESAAERLSTESSDEMQRQLKVVQFDGNERHFYSVDLNGGVPRDSVWYRKGFESVFNQSSGFERSEETSLNQGTLAMLYGECPLEMVDTSVKQGETPELINRLEFNSNFRNA